MGLIAVISVSALAYRFYYHGGANEIAKFLLRRACHDYRQVRQLPEALRRALSWILLDPDEGTFAKIQRVPSPVCLTHGIKASWLALFGAQSASLQPSRSVISNNSDSWYKANRTASPVPQRKDDASGEGSGKAEGAVFGAAIGATAATAASLVTMRAIPGVGAVVGAGWLAAMLGSIAIGGVAAGLLGALSNAGIGEEDAQVFVEGARRITDVLMLPEVREQFAKIAVEPFGGSVAETTKFFAEREKWRGVIKSANVTVDNCAGSPLPVLKPLRRLGANLDRGLIDRRLSRRS